MSDLVVKGERRLRMILLKYAIALLLPVSFLLAVRIPGQGARDVLLGLFERRTPVRSDF